MRFRSNLVNRRKKIRNYLPVLEVAVLLPDNIQNTCIASQSVVCFSRERFFYMLE